MQQILGYLVERFKSYLNSRKSKMAAVRHLGCSKKVFFLLAMVLNFGMNACKKLDDDWLKRLKVN